MAFIVFFCKNILKKRDRQLMNRLQVEKKKSETVNNEIERKE